MKSKNLILSVISLILVTNLTTSCENTQAQKPKLTNDSVEVTEKPFFIALFAIW